MARTCKSLHSRLASGTGTATRSRRLIVTPGRFSGAPLAERFSTHFRRPISHNARACSAVVLPELLGPTKTTVLPSSISTSSRRLKFLTRRLVSTSDDVTAPRAGVAVQQSFSRGPIAFSRLRYSHRETLFQLARQILHPDF